MRLVGWQERPISTATIVVVAPAGFVRDAIQSVLQTQGHTVIGSCENLDQIVSGRELPSPPDLFVVGGYGSEHSAKLSSIIRQMRLRIPATKWIVLGPGADSTLLRSALEAGADGLLLDDAPSEVLRSLTSLVLL